MDLEGVLFCSSDIFCARLAVKGKTVEYIAGKWEEALHYGIKQLQAYHANNVEAELLTPDDQDNPVRIKF